MIRVSVSGHSKLRRQLRAVALPPREKKQLFFRLGRGVIKESAARTRAQKTVDGRTMTPRKNGNKKVLRKIMRSARVIGTSTTGATVGWPRGITGIVAAKQHHGHVEKYSKARIQREKGKPDYDAPATYFQAKALIKEGFKLYIGKYKGGQKAGQVKTRRVSIRWIMENMTIGQAGAIGRTTVAMDKFAWQHWEARIPPRPFLGVSRQKIPAMGQQIIQQITTNARNAGA